MAVIMDGNGRWAEARGLRRTDGHRAGIDSVREITTSCAELGLVQLTLYAFSTENWKRPKHEVAMLMTMLREFLLRERPTIMDNNIRLRAIGETERLPLKVQKVLAEVMTASASNDGMVLCLALSYGARQEILRATKEIARAVQAGRLDPEAIDEQTFAANLYDPTMPDPDLLVRTAGEMRISNFLLWQISYSEVYVTDVCWPEFRRAELVAALEAYTQRKRKFGGLLK